MLLMRLDGPEGEMVGVLVTDGLPEELGRLRALLPEAEPAKELGFRGASLALCKVEVFDESGVVVLRTVDDVVLHVSERGFYVTGKLDSEPVRTWDVEWSTVL